MTKTIISLGAAFWLGLGALWPQNFNFQQISFPVTVNGQTLKFPFAGGLNSPQFSPADLNQDGVLDLVVFDRVGDVVLTFLHTNTNGADGYVYAPEYAANFPYLLNYMLMRDYNGDGAADIFASSTDIATQEIQVFRGYFENNMLKFKQFYFTYPGCTFCNPKLVYYPDEVPGVYNNLAVQRVDLPDFNDIDGDGDLDILTFEATVGGYLYWFKNESIEKGFGKDSLKFALVDRCWGDFFEGGLVRCKNNLSVETDICASFVKAPNDTRHPGSTVTSYDHDGDGDRELILGDVSFSCLNWQLNSGTPQDAWMTVQDTAFPSYDISADIANFPAAFYFDVDHDGHNDIVAAPNNKSISEDIRSAWYYRNIATQGHEFRLAGKAFLIDDMIDVGTIAHPAFADVNGDGLLDLIVGNYGFYAQANPTNSRLVLFLNNGTAQLPSFVRTDTDWLTMSQFSAMDYEFSPAFGDLDSDGDLDLLVGSATGIFYYYKNNAGPGQPMNLTLSNIPGLATLDIGIASAPFLYDLDNDGLLDIIAGERQGNINFIKNTGTPTSPQFADQPTISNLGGINTTAPNDFIGFSAPVIVLPPKSTTPLLITGAQNGSLKAFSGISASSSAFTVVSDDLGQLKPGNRSHPAFADLDSDGILEMALGNSRGGLQLFRLLPASAANDPYPSKNTIILKIMPNPGSDHIVLSAESVETGLYRIYDVTGKLMTTGKLSAGQANLLVSDWPSGVYIAQVNDSVRTASVRFVVK